MIDSSPLPKATIEGNFNTVVSIVFVLAALLSILFIVIGGIKYTISAGDSSGIQKAKNTILYAIVGLVVTLSAYTILNFVTGRIG